MTHNIKQRVRDGKVEYFDENNGWLDKQEYFDLIPGSDIETEEDDDLTPDYLTKKSGESEDSYRSRIRDIYDNISQDDED